MINAAMGYYVGQAAGMAKVLKDDISKDVGAQMNKEAIERTKARCKKEIKYKDKIVIAPGWYIKKNDYISDRLNNHAAVNPREVGVIVPRADYIPEINLWAPLSKK